MGVLGDKGVLSANRVDNRHGERLGVVLDMATSVVGVSKWIS